MIFTQNPIGSSATEDLQDNAISFDYAMNSPAALWQDRFGKQHKTVQQALKDVGFKPAGFDFVSGGTLGIGDRDKCVFYPTDGHWYSWNGKLPYVVPANSTPTPAGKKGWKQTSLDINGKFVTTSELLTLGSSLGTYVYIIDRDFALYRITAGSFPNGMDILPAGTLKVAEYVITGPVNPVHLGAKGDYLLENGTHNPLKTENSVFINRALEISSDVKLPSGNFFISKHIRLKKPLVRFTGAGISETKIYADDTMEPVTIGESSGTVMVWYQPDGKYNEPNWIEGGTISDMFLNGSNGAVEGIRINRVCQSQCFSNLRIAGCSKGIYGTFFGWGTVFDNLFIHDCKITAIHLTGAYNGCTFTGVRVWGGDLPDFGTEVLVLIENDSFGNNWSGGYIEKGLVGVRLISSQLNITGCDLEMFVDSFIQVRGKYEGGILQAPGPVSVVTGCTFVGAPGRHGLTANGAQLLVKGNTFINNSEIPNSTTRAIFGEYGGGVSRDFGYPCISEQDNIFLGTVGWKEQTTGGVIFTMATKYAAKGYMFPLAAGETPEQRTLSDFKTFTCNTIGLSSNNFTPYQLSETEGNVSKIGKLVTINLLITIMSKPSSGSYAVLKDLPYLPNTKQRLIGEYVVYPSVTQQTPFKHGKVVIINSHPYLSTSEEEASLLDTLAPGNVLGITLNFHV